MKKAKKAQTFVFSVLLIVIALILVIFLLSFVIFEGFNSANQNPNPSTTGKAVSNQQENYNYQNQVVCYYPYIKVGVSCCLDQNHNGICDNDEASLINQNQNQDNNNCEYPYINVDSRCCLDQNHNGICDLDDHHNRDREYEDLYVRHASLESPFHLTNVKVYRSSIELEIKNNGDSDYTIKSIDIFECGTENFNRVLAKGDSTNFDIECDSRVTQMDSDLEVRYTTNDSNSTQIAQGKIDIEY